MSDWAFERATLMKDLKDAHDCLALVLKSPNIWHRVRQTSQRALEQVEVAMQQLSEQEAPL
jgi:hypothetical protein